MQQMKETTLENPLLAPTQKTDTDVGGWQETSNFLCSSDGRQQGKSLLLALFIQQQLAA